MPFWLETPAANDTWQRFGDDAQSLAEAEDRARAIIRCKVVTPDGVRILWTPGVLPRAPHAPRSPSDGAERHPAFQRSRG